MTVLKKLFHFIKSAQTYNNVYTDSLNQINQTKNDLASVKIKSYSEAMREDAKNIQSDWEKVLSRR